MKKVVFLICLLLTTSIVLSACSDWFGSTAVVEFLSHDVKIMPGETYQLQYVVPKGKSVTFSSSNDTVLTVDQNGIVTGVRVGTASVIASVGKNRDAYLEITVTEDLMPAMVNAVLNANNLELHSNMQYDLTLDVQKAGAPVQYSVEWKSSNEQVATVTNGKVTAASEGSAVITATVTTDDATIIKQCCVTVFPHYRLELDQRSVSGAIGTEFTLSVKIYDDTGKLVTPAKGELEMISSNPKIIEVREDSFKIIGAGKVAAGIRYKGNVASIPVNIFWVSADFFQKAASDFHGEINGESFSGVVLESTTREPYFYFTDEGRNEICDFVKENGYTTVRIHCYPILQNYSMMINGQTVENECWSTVDFSVDQISKSFYFWSQSRGSTTVYLWFEFI